MHSETADMSQPSRVGLIDHLKESLGQIQRTWHTLTDGTEAPFQIVECKGGMIEDASAFITLGLGQEPLGCPVPEKIIRHELLITVRSDQNDQNIPEILLQVGSEAVKRGSAYLAGEVIGPRAPLFKGSLLEALYVAIPVYYPDEFAVYENPDGDDIVIAWLIPITHAEAHYVFDKGWSAFENLLVEKDPDLLDIFRPSIVD